MVYIAETGLDYGNVRVERGDLIVEPLPEESVPWLLEQGHITEIPVEVDEDVADPVSDDDLEAFLKDDE